MGTHNREDSHIVQMEGHGAITISLLLQVLHIVPPLWRMVNYVVHQ